jgi:hypothetical protein
MSTMLSCNMPVDEAVHGDWSWGSRRSHVVDYRDARRVRHVDNGCCELAAGREVMSQGEAVC